MWRYTPQNKLMPLDAEPGDEYRPGTYIVEGPENCRPADQMFDAGESFFMNHWATCPMANEFKRKGPTS